MNNSYGIFCIAMAMDVEDQNTRQLDIWWERATKLYDEFIDSKFNNTTESELDCINNFMVNKKVASDQIK
jgi:hypothetical protein